MNSIIASAPGKVVLSGEYAVLDGAPAICMAVNRRATARVTRIDAQWNSVTSPGYSAVQGRFIDEAGIPRWLQGEHEYSLVDSAWRVLDPAKDGRVAIELDTRDFYDLSCGTKLGLGSSAALTVALTAALTSSSDVLRDAMRVHRQFQSGAGSGVDIASSVHGGLLEYRMRGAAIRALEWPAGLIWRLVWTGVPASTAGKLNRLRAKPHSRSQAALLDAATTMAGAWRTASTALGELPAYIAALRQFSDHHDLGIFDAGHDKLAAEASAAGLVYKPCGAGGGDVGILLGTNSKQLDDFLGGMTLSACRTLQCELAKRGVERVQH